eukprot:TRINITY_DN21076_c0_g1_i1.p1 TRINITY_DN21076_c0_g1~~TRINITY_DN21076_c0_g1_i1.p1  ORF type:complete len:547 (+),score=105.42 TRINITY_DN21076_c0_g1_i1:145-1785(+)
MGVKNGKKAPSSLAIFLCDTIEASLNLLSKSKSAYFLEKAFAPVEEGPLETNLPVVGTLPACLNGEFVRNGPNPKLRPSGGYHLFDGDGMLHGVLIKDGKASYVNRYVQTSRLSQEVKKGAPLFIKLGDMRGFVGLLKILLYELRAYLGVIDKTNGEGTGNTALAYHNGSLMALHEGDAPYAIQVMADGQLETAGRMTYGGKLDHFFTAHPKIDPVTGEMFAFGYNVQKPQVKYRVISKDGVMRDAVVINLPHAVMMHDFAITEKYAIFLDMPLIFSPKEIVKTGFPFQYDASLPARFGLLPRYATSEASMRWFELPSQFIFHTANAWDEGDEVVLVACRFPYMDLSIADGDKADELDLSLYEYRFNTSTGASSMRELADFRTDFPRINDAFLGRKQRYVYCGTFSHAKVHGVAKFDLTLTPDVRSTDKVPRLGGTCVGYVSHGPSRFGSEPVFVPRYEDPSQGDEDDGYLLNYVSDEVTGVSEMVVLDAKSMSAEPVAVVKLPRRVPSGFHGIFVSQAQIQAQKEAILGNGPSTSSDDVKTALLK